MNSWRNLFSRVREMLLPVMTDELDNLMKSNYLSKNTLESLNPCLINLQVDKRTWSEIT